MVQNNDKKGPRLLVLNIFLTNLGNLSFAKRYNTLLCTLGVYTRTFCASNFFFIGMGKDGSVMVERLVKKTTFSRSFP